MDSDLVRRAFAAYLEDAEEADATRLRFFEGLWELQQTIAAKTSDYQPMNATAARQLLASGQTIFEVNPPSVPLDDYLDALSHVARYIADKAGLPADQAQALGKADFASVIMAEVASRVSSSPAAFIEAAVERLAAAPTAPSTTTLAFALTAALTPFLEGAAEKSLAALDKDARSASSMLTHCPVCGAVPALSLVGERTPQQGAGRTLWCGLCHAEWDFERIRCARCGSRSERSLRYVNLQGDEAHKLHLCDECHGYTRTIFQSFTTKPLSLLVEDIVSAGLSSIALEQGYTIVGDSAAA